MNKGASLLLFSSLKRPQDTGMKLPAARDLHVDNITPPAIRRFFQLDSWFGKGSKIRLETLKPLENTGLFRFVEIIPQGHSYAVAAIESGDDIKTVQTNLGHATASFTLDVYGHASQKMRQQSAARMEQYISVVLSN